MNYISLKDCLLGHVYLIHSRNLGIGVYDGKGGFVGIREKFDREYLFTEYHWDQGAPYGTVKPDRDIEVLPPDVPVSTDFVHDKGRDWAERDGRIFPVVRRDLRAGETPHGKRQGFVDEWADTGERMPDDRYPFLRENEALFNYLKGLREGA
jgi:hypothetical protein